MHEGDGSFATSAGASACRSEDRYEWHHCSDSLNQARASVVNDAISFREHDNDKYNDYHSRATLERNMENVHNVSID